MRKKWANAYIPCSQRIGFAFASSLSQGFALLADFCVAKLVGYAAGVKFYW
ncbi:MAG: hypothetical protein HDR52_00630 [Treponema sp.]|nr:hypothetical protein [Treponema sp.]